MNKKRIIFITLMAGMFSHVSAQETIWNRNQVVSPEINADQTVTFRVKAPDAKDIKLSGDWLPLEGWFPGKVDLTKDEQGLWTYTSEALEPDLYRYYFLIDGVRCPDPGDAFTTRDISINASIFLIDKGHADLYSVNDVPHGSVTRRWYDSPGLEKKRRITIYTPPGYEDSKDAYPVLYLLHGAGGDEEAWIELGRTSQIMDNLIDRGEAKPMIVVMPNGNSSQEAAPGEGIRGYYTPQFMETGNMEGSFESAFMDIVEFVESSYRVKPGKANRAIAGLSMGGFHSLHISRYYPNTFDYIGLFSAAILPRQGINSEVYRDMDSTLKVQKENGYRLYWIGIGKSDFLYQNVVDYKKKLDEMGMVNTFRESEGGHTWKNWRTYLTEFVPLLFN